MVQHDTFCFHFINLAKAEFGLPIFVEEFNEGKENDRELEEVNLAYLLRFLLVFSLALFFPSHTPLQIYDPNKPANPVSLNQHLMHI